MTNSPDRITSKANPRIKALCLLKDEPSRERFLIEGKHLTDMAFEASCLDEVFSVDPIDYPGVKNTLVSLDVLQKLAVSKTPSGIVGLAHAPLFGDVSGKAVWLDRVQDPGNLGTILRTAVAFGYREVVCSKGAASAFSPKVIASSQGAVFKIKITEGVDLCAFAAEKKAQGIEVIASALRGAVPLKEFSRPVGDFALILGNEGQGIETRLLDLASRIVKIEMEGIESLNVGVAGGILMHCL